MGEYADRDEVEGKTVYCVEEGEEEDLDLDAGGWVPVSRRRRRTRRSGRVGLAHVDEPLSDSLCELGVFLYDLCDVEQPVGCADRIGEQDASERADKWDEAD